MSSENLFAHNASGLRLETPEEEKERLAKAPAEAGPTEKTETETGAESAPAEVGTAESAPKEPEAEAEAAAERRRAADEALERLRQRDQQKTQEALARLQEQASANEETFQKAPAPEGNVTSIGRAAPETVEARDVELQTALIRGVQTNGMGYDELPQVFGKEGSDFSAKALEEMTQGLFKAEGGAASAELSPLERNQALELLKQAEKSSLEKAAQYVVSGDHADWEKARLAAGDDNQFAASLSAKIRQNSLRRDFVAAASVVVGATGTFGALVATSPLVGATVGGVALAPFAPLVIPAAATLGGVIAAGWIGKTIYDKIRERRALKNQARVGIARRARALLGGRQDGQSPERAQAA